MEMHQVKYFLAVCEYRNFTQAAKAVNVSQPALTTAIQKLEEELGGPVFLRDRSGCQLTPLGNVVRPRMQHIHDESLSVINDAVRHVRLDRIPIRIGLYETVGGNVFAKKIAQFQSANPKIEIEIIYRNTQAALEELRNGFLDIVIAPDGDFPADIYRIDPLYTESYKVVFSEGHRFEALEEVALEELSGETYLDRPNCEMREALFALCDASGVEIYASYRSNRETWLLLLASEGVGVTILPESCIPDSLPGVMTRNLTEPGIHRTLIALRYRKQPSKLFVHDLLRALAE